jgi:hypothetical protein
MERCVSLCLQTTISLSSVTLLRPHFTKTRARQISSSPANHYVIYKQWFRTAPEWITLYNNRYVIRMCKHGWRWVWMDHVTPFLSQIRSSWNCIFQILSLKIYGVRRNRSIIIICIGTVGLSLPTDIMCSHFLPVPSAQRNQLLGCKTAMANSEGVPILAPRNYVSNGGTTPRIHNSVS